MTATVYSNGVVKAGYARQRSLVRLLPTLLFVFVPPLSSSFALEPSELYLKAEAEFRNLWAFECTYSMKEDIRIKGTRPRSHTKTVYLQYNRPYFWARERLVNGTFSDVTYTSFNGKVCYSLRMGEQVLFLSDTRKLRSQGFGPPKPVFFIPYSFVYEPRYPLGFSAFAQAETWADAAKRTRILGESQVDGVPTVEAEVAAESSRKAENITYHVSFARDFGFYPIASTATCGTNGVGRMIVKAYGQIFYPGGTLRVPSLCELFYAERGDEFIVSSRWDLDLKTFRCGQRLPMEAFTLAVPRSIAVWDQDSGVHLKEAETDLPSNLHILPLQ